MTTLTVQEATQGLGGWLRRAVNGERIAINEGGTLVLLQPVGTDSPDVPIPQDARHALRTLQAHPSLSATQADKYLQELREERLADRAPAPQ